MTSNVRCSLQVGTEKTGQPAGVLAPILAVAFRTTD